MAESRLRAHAHPAAAPSTGAYSQALSFGDFVMISGQGPLDSNGVAVAGTIEEETTRALKSIRLHLEHAGARLDQIVKCGCFLADISEFDGFDRAYGRFFGDHFPAARPFRRVSSESRSRSTRSPT